LNYKFVRPRLGQRLEGWPRSDWPQRCCVSFLAPSVALAVDSKRPAYTGGTAAVFEGGFAYCRERWRMGIADIMAQGRPALAGLPSLNPSALPAELI